MAGKQSQENGRKGGRPKGSTTRPQLRDFYTEKELADFVKDLKASAKKDPMLKKFVAEQIFGKAPQPLTGPEGGALLIQFDRAFAPKTKGNSE